MMKFMARLSILVIFGGMFSALFVEMYDIGYTMLPAHILGWVLAYLLLIVGVVVWVAIGEAD